MGYRLVAKVRGQRHARSGSMLQGITAKHVSANLRTSGREDCRAFPFSGGAAGDLSLLEPPVPPSPSFLLLEDAS